MFRKIRKYKFSETAFLTKSARNGVRNLTRNANAGPMVKTSSKSVKWRRKIRTFAKICKIPNFRTIICETPLDRLMKEWSLFVNFRLW